MEGTPASPFFTSPYICTNNVPHSESSLYIWQPFCVATKLLIEQLQILVNLSTVENHSYMRRNYIIMLKPTMISSTHAETVHSTSVKFHMPKNVLRWSVILNSLYWLCARAFIERCGSLIVLVCMYVRVIRSTKRLCWGTLYVTHLLQPVYIISGWSYGSICTALSHIFMLTLVIYCRCRMAAIDLLCVVASLIRILIGCLLIGCQSLKMGKCQVTGKCAELGLGYI